MSTQSDRTATTRQVDLIEKLLGERDLMSSPRHFDRVNAMDHDEHEQYVKSLVTRARDLSVRDASRLIDELLKLPALNAQAAAKSEGPLPDVPPKGNRTVIGHGTLVRQNNVAA